MYTRTLCPYTMYTRTIGSTIVMMLRNISYYTHYDASTVRYAIAIKVILRCVDVVERVLCITSNGILDYTNIEIQSWPLPRPHYRGLPGWMSENLWW